MRQALLAARSGGPAEVGSDVNAGGELGREDMVQRPAGMGTQKSADSHESAAGLQSRLAVEVGTQQASVGPAAPPEAKHGAEIRPHCSEPEAGQAEVPGEEVLQRHRAADRAADWA